MSATAGWQGASGGTGTTGEIERAHADLDRLGVPRMAGQLVLTLSARIGWLVARRPQPVIDVDSEPLP